MDYWKIIDRFYSDDSELRHILVTHSQSVMRKALQIFSSHPELCIDADFLREASMLHDIGIVKCHAPGIRCYGTEPYIRHGRMGAEMLREAGFPMHARVCERHTGAGLSKDEIIRQRLPLPHEDFLPETMEEQVICYADKFFSKTHLDHEKTVAEAERSLAKFGPEGVERFRRWAAIFE